MMHQQGVEFFLVSTLNRENVNCVPDMIKLAEKYDTTVHIRPTIRTGAASVNKIERLDLAKILSRFLTHPNVRNGLLETKKTIPPAKYYGCGIRKRISVSAKGVLFPCVMDRNEPSLNILECNQQALVEALNHEARVILEKHQKCRDCQLTVSEKLPRCGGFCRFSNSYLKEVIP